LATAPGDVEPIWRGLAARAQALGWTLPDPPDLVNEPDLHIVANGRRIDAVVAEDGRYIFAVPPCNRSPRLVSRTVRPSDLCAWLDDRRRLGVQVCRMIVHHGQDVADIPKDHPMLTEGWWAAEQDDGALCRWTDGDAALAPTDFGLIEIRLAGRLRYPASGRRFSATPPARIGAEPASTAYSRLTSPRMFGKASSISADRGVESRYGKLTRNDIADFGCITDNADRDVRTYHHIPQKPFCNCACMSKA
jgi:hypothetical protein